MRDNALRFQIGILEKGKHAKYLPYAFTEQGIAMLSSVLNSERAVQVNIAIIRAFVKLRQVLAAHKELACKFKELEDRVGKHDVQITAIFNAIKKMMALPKKPKRRIGFLADRQ
ncbi:MAG: ORF6N domain-containing protein [Candidatus Margulisbacteria bacterium]|nr:ORF6N domain-containing protein [Candidatus Margulisiibacteriota bacterium]